MASLHTFKRKALSIAGVGAIVAMLIPTGVPAQSAPEPLDLPITLLQPADVAGAGFENYGLVMGWTANNEDLAYDMVNRQGYDEADAREGIEASGMGTIFFQSLHPIVETPSDGPLVGIAIETSITAFTDTEHAEDGIDFMRLGAEEEMDADPPSIGDYAEMGVLEFPAGEISELPLNEIDVVMRFDHVVARFSLLGYDTEVEQADAVALAEVFGEKVDALMNGEKIGATRAPELSLMVPTYFDEAACVCRMQYTVVGGQALPLSYLHDAQLDLEDRATEYGMASQFYQLVRYAGDGASGGTDPSMYVRISKFSQADDAARYVADAPDWVDGGYLNTETPYTNVVEADAADQIAAGESAVTLSYDNVSFNGDDLQGLIAIVQDGRYVYEVSIDGFTAPDTELLQQMVDQLLGCADGSCTGITEVPAELMTYFAGPGDQE
jgi:hypothetical protein